MKRRTFCTSAVAAVTAASLPWERLLAAAAADADSPAVGQGGQQVTLSQGDIAEFRASLRGGLLTPGQEGYEAARRIWNGAFDRKPALIARCAGAADVVRAVKFGRTHDLLVAVRGGGHSLSGQSVCEGGLMIDLSPMKSVRVDPLAKTARVEPGVLLGQFDREAQAFGLATTAGTVSHTGAAGLTLGGGFGRIGRKYGLACDNLRAADIVTADGQFIKASAHENSDLLWGLRGGGGNFGIVTSFEYQLHAVGPLMFGGTLAFPFAQAREVLRFFSEFIAGAPDELYIDAAVVPTPDGKRLVAFDICYSGPMADGERVLAPLRTLRTPVLDRLGATPYVELQQGLDAANPIGRSYYIKSGFVKRIEPAMIDAVVGHLESSPVPSSIVIFAHHGGAIGRVKPEASAFWHREANHSVILQAFWDNPAAVEPNMQWVRDTWKDVEPLTNGFYVNEVSRDDSERRIHANYGGNYPRLVALKNKYDPKNLFRLNANVKPTA